MISGYTREAGVRNLERKIGEICRKAAREIYQGDKTKIKITESNLEKNILKRKNTALTRRMNRMRLVLCVDWHGQASVEIPCR